MKNKQSEYYKSLRQWAIGKKFGFLLAVEDLGRNHKSKKLTYIRCLCDCGKEAIVQYQNLKKGKSKSCGCRFTNYLGEGTAAKRFILRQYKRNAKQRQLSWN